MKPIILISSGLALLILIIISIAGGFFGAWSFFAIIFYFALYIGGYLYIKIGMENRESDYDKVLQRRQKFAFCWERVNQILKSMPGGQGVSWSSGVGRRSNIKSYFDGVQNKPFRSILAHLEYTQQFVLIIFDIEGDDIADFITNPSVELIDNPFLNFRPFNRGDDFNRFDNKFNNVQPINYKYNRQSRHNSGGFSVNINSNDSFGDLEEQKREKVTPKRDVVEKAMSRLRK